MSRSSWCSSSLMVWVEHEPARGSTAIATDRGVEMGANRSHRFAASLPTFLLVPFPRSLTIDLVANWSAFLYCRPIPCRTKKTNVRQNHRGVTCVGESDLVRHSLHRSSSEKSRRSSKDRHGTDWLDWSGEVHVLDGCECGGTATRHRRHKRAHHPSTIQEVVSTFGCNRRPARDDKWGVLVIAFAMVSSPATESACQTRIATPTTQLLRNTGQRTQRFEPRREIWEVAAKGNQNREGSLEPAMPEANPARIGIRSASLVIR